MVHRKVITFDDSDHPMSPPTSPRGGHGSHKDGSQSHRDGFGGGHKNGKDDDYSNLHDVDKMSTFKKKMFQSSRWVLAQEDMHHHTTNEQSMADDDDDLFEDDPEDFDNMNPAVDGVDFQDLVGGQAIPMDGLSQPLLNEALNH